MTYPCPGVPGDGKVVAMVEGEAWVLAQPTFEHHERGEYTVKRVRVLGLRELGPFGMTYIGVDCETGQILGEYLPTGLYQREESARRTLERIREGR